MLPSRHRLRRTEEIAATLKRGRCFSTPYLRGCVKSSSAPYLRSACVVGKRVSASAVVRHRYQRWLRELVWEVIQSGESVKVDLVLVAQPGIVRFSSLLDLRTALLSLLRDAIASVCRSA